MRFFYLVCGMDRWMDLNLYEGKWKDLEMEGKRNFVFETN